METSKFNFYDSGTKEARRKLNERLKLIDLLHIHDNEGVGQSLPPWQRHRLRSGVTDVEFN